MNSKIQIYCVNLGKYINVEGGETLKSIWERTITPEIRPIHPICARVNNRTEDLSFPVYAPKQVEFIDDTTPSGYRVYVRSLCMILYRAIADVCPDMRLRIEHSVSKGFYCRIFKKNGEITTPDADTLNRIGGTMKALVDADKPFIRQETHAKDVADIFRKQGLDNKVLLMDSLHELYWTFYELDGIADSYYGALAPSTAYIDSFSLTLFKEGFLLFGKDAVTSGESANPPDQEKLFHAFTEYMRFNKVIKVSSVGELNRAVRQKQTAQLINVAEAMHDKLIGRISDRITERTREAGTQVVFIAGPSSSGKTTSTKRLGIQLMTNLLTPKMISLDDYFVDRVHTPRDESGDYDYESLYALDLERLNNDLRALLRGETINLPTYSFELGQRIELERPMKLNSDEILLIEGIHGLNPELSSEIADEHKFHVYVSALTTLCIDDHNWIPTTDNRLLRRIVRDAKYRNTSAFESLKRWPSVRRGEERWIFPYQENADATFNSSLIFELGVMRDYAIPLLREVPHDSDEYTEAYRLMRFLRLFEPIPANQIPTTSLLREFLGGSSFQY